ncbi:hypothetical protein IT409_00975 [Candidatus Falkowbacteria bacterium]|nr:hypothetical protein [Candidatus Falkowbacteria bacterium]
MTYISTNDPAVTIETARSSGAGGQNVNKTESKAVLKINLVTCKGLTDTQKDILLGIKEIKLSDQAQKLLAKTKNSITSEGILVTTNQESRDLQKNKENVLRIINQALEVVLTPEKERKEGLTKEGKAKKKARARQDQLRKYKDQKARLR